MTSVRAVSVLDLATVADGATEAQALERAVRLAERADDLGYTRFWTAEHHGMPAIASTSPDLIALRIADRTRRIRVGAGGVMLPNHAPLQVAERYLTLEAFHPGRIDLGVGRAPGTDGLTAAALRRSDASGYPDQLAELDAYLDDRAPHIRALPRGGSRPALFLLGSSLASAQLAAARGDAYAFAGHFSLELAETALRLYRDRFVPGALRHPHAILAVSALAADTAEHAEWIVQAQRLASLRFARGEAAAMPSPEAAARHRWTDQELAVACSFSPGQIVGDAETVADALDRLARLTGADELMITANVHGFDDHVRSLELIASSLGIRPALAGAEVAA